jgi:hypothetical protein
MLKKKTKSNAMVTAFTLEARPQRSRFENLTDDDLSSITAARRGADDIAHLAGALRGWGKRRG